MAGIYIHIPFCKQACHYCDFHFSTVLSSKEAIVDALKRELELRSREPGFQKDTLIETIYFGGGTPSLLTATELDSIFNTIYKHFTISEQAEITLEANPDDLTITKLEALKSTPVNRLSIGIQSFHDPHLQFMNRAHTSGEATRCIENARQFGFEHLNLDLIFGIPANSSEEGNDILQKDLDRFFALQPDHISAYALTIEEKTTFGNWTRKGKMPEIKEDYTARQFEMVMDALVQNGYDQYEISNFCREGHYSKHNTSYWQGVSYLGIGPSAHSYNSTLKTRSFNAGNNARYLSALQQNRLVQTIENLSKEEQINDYLLTRLRTKWGLNADYLQQQFNHDIRPLLSEFEEDGFIIQTNHSGVFTLTRKGMLIADFISERLFV